MSPVRSVPDCTNDFPVSNDRWRSVPSVDVYSDECAAIRREASLMAALDEWMDFSCAYFRAFLLEVMTYQPSSYSILWPRRLAEVSGMTSSRV